MAAAMPSSLNSGTTSSSNSKTVDGASSSKAAGISSSSSNSGGGGGWSDVSRVSLGKLYEAYGCPHPMKATVGKSFDEHPRWRLHMDVERSVDAMLSGHTHHTHDSFRESGSGRHHQQCPAAPTIDTQLRSRDGSGRLMVKFETPGAAQQALRAAAMVKAAAAAATAATAGVGDAVGTENAVDSGDVINGDGGMDYAAAAAVGPINGGSGFKGGWFVDLFHAGVHRAIEAACSAGLWDTTGRG